MSLIIDHEHLRDTESDIERISQASSLGSLADDVLLELIQLEAGIKDPSDLVAVPESAELFHALADQLDNPRMIWSATSAATALLRFSSETAPSSGHTVVSDEELPAWCKALAGQLGRLRETPISMEDLASVRAQFTSIAQVTLRAAATAARPHYSLI